MAKYRKIIRVVKPKEESKGSKKDQALEKEEDSYSKRAKAIGNKLRELRLESGYPSYDLFAWENGLSRGQYFKMEQGSNFTLKSLLKILDIHNITLDEFFKGLT